MTAESQGQGLGQALTSASFTMARDADVMRKRL